MDIFPVFHNGATPIASFVNCNYLIFKLRTFFGQNLVENRSLSSYKKLHSHFQKIALQKGYVKHLVLLYLVMLSRKVGRGFHTIETMISNLK